VPRTWIRSALPAALLATLTVAGCTASDPVKRNEPSDAGASTELPAPKLDPVPERTPRTTVAIRGSTEGARVVSLGSQLGTVVTAVLPGGTFCQEAPISSGDNQLDFYAVGGDGRLSAPASVAVTFDPSAPAPANPSCSGSSGGDCAATEVCGTDDVDEDCNGWADQCDLACSACVDDAYEPNDIAVNVPTIEPGTYDMVLCPCRDDWFAFHVNAGNRIRATANFTDALIDIDLRLYQVNPDGSGTGALVASSVTTGNTEAIDYSATAAGTYYLRVYPFKQADKPSGTYQLVIP
jgi:hypothetical protein